MDKTIREQIGWVDARNDPELQKFIDEHKSSCYTIGDLVDKFLEEKRAQTRQANG